ncbi:cyclophilin-like fold protein [Granulicatella seriolae]|uniref:Cyclophilin-like fold protein n=1 Tax=Granulicatella seriolae TaxID=2967226 RepID=A0ABT1WPL9_9LACT|nr:cyclophilin-like fold protein [Granulicatella seriolae]
MRKTIVSLMFIVCLILLTSCSSHVVQSDLPISKMTETNSNSTMEERVDTGEEAMKNNLLPITIQVNGKNFKALMQDNETARTFIEQLPLTLTMDDYASQEKVTSLPFSVTSTQTHMPSTINAGELYLWSDSNLVLFYETFSNSYTYIPLGYIEDISGLEETLGKDSVQVTFQK